MKKMAPTVSIVVPTRNRPDCIKVLIRSLMETDQVFQLIVTDNSDEYEIDTFIENYKNDSRLNYSYNPDKLSVVENFNQALDRSTCDFVVFIGDDDLLSTHFFEVVDLAASYDADAVIYGKPGCVLHYFWPGVEALHWGDIGGSLFYSEFTGDFIQTSHQVSIHNAVLKLGSGPCDMPRAYLGLISRNVINRIKEKYGPIFGGCSPDIYSSHLVATCAEKVFICDYPFIIPGASPKSTSAKRAERSDTGGLLDNDHLSRFANMKWDERVPKFYAPFTVWAQSHLEALAKTNYHCPLSAFVSLYAKCLVFTRGHHSEVLKAIGSGRSLMEKAAIYLLLVPILMKTIVQYSLEKIPAIIRRRPGGAKFQIKECDDIFKAVLKLERNLQDNGINIKIK